jgi:hypothetical protein
MAGIMIEVAAALAADGLPVEVSGPSAPLGPIAPADSRFHRSYAIWSQYRRRQGDRDGSICRVEAFLGRDRARRPEAAGEAAR